MSKRRTVFARHDAAHCNAPGLFRPLKKGDYKRLKLDVTYVYGKTELRFRGPEPLGGTELRVLQAIVASAGPSTRNLKVAAPAGDLGERLAQRLAFLGQDADTELRVVSTTLGALIAEAGYKSDCRSQRESMRESLRRLAAVTIFCIEGSRERSMRVLSYDVDMDTGGLSIAINARLSAAVAGGGYTHICMDEVRALKSDPARVLHQRLCGYINPGKRHLTAIGVDTLVGHVYGELKGVAAATIRQRRSTVRGALKELVELSWDVRPVGTAYSIERPTL
ncbi:replication protein C, IncQ-type [Paucibacter sp. JuS9]|uniref:replication protein C, IncQ-type n=1 Tax=Paucibacter sp. JuS9 TaxID=3228748 RepID=UPI003756ABA9